MLITNSRLNNPICLNAQKLQCQNTIETTSKTSVTATLPKYTPNELYFRARIDYAKERKQIVSMIKNNQLEVLGEGLMGICYKYTRKKPNGSTEELAVKVAKDNIANHRDKTFKREAQVLHKIAIDENIQHFVDRFEADGKYYLVSNLIKGSPINKLPNDINAKQVEGIVNIASVLDKHGTMNYDFNAGGFLVDGDKVGAVDFEFSHQMCPLCLTQNRDFYNNFRNPFQRRNSNIESIEHRFLYPYLIERIHPELPLDQLYKHSESVIKSPKAMNLFTTYLKTLSGYSSTMSEHMEKNAATLKIPPKAIDYEKKLSKIYAKPTPQVVKLEASKLEIKYLMMEYYLDQRGDKTKPMKKAQTLSKEIDKMTAKTKSPIMKEYFTVNKSWLNEFLGSEFQDIKTQ